MNTYLKIDDHKNISLKFNFWEKRNKRIYTEGNTSNCLAHEGKLNKNNLDYADV